MATIRRIASFVLLIVAVISLISFFMASGTILVDAFKMASNFKEYADAIYRALEALSVPLVMMMLALIGLTWNSRQS